RDQVLFRNVRDVVVLGVFREQVVKWLIAIRPDRFRNLGQPVFGVRKLGIHIEDDPAKREHLVFHHLTYGEFSFAHVLLLQKLLPVAHVTKVGGRFCSYKRPRALRVSWGLGSKAAIWEQPSAGSRTPARTQGFERNDQRGARGAPAL